MTALVTLHQPGISWIADNVLTSSQAVSFRPWNARRHFSWILGDSVSEKQHIKRALKEAELYQAQGLVEEAKGKYEELLKFIGESQNYSNHEKLIGAVRGKIQALDQALSKIEGAPVTLELSHNVQDLIKNLFTFSQTEQAAAMEGAVALAKFGQFERALNEFRSLLDQGVMPVMAAKNIIRCYLSMNETNAVVGEFEQWISRDVFSTEDLRDVRTFVQGALERQGLELKLPEVTEPKKPGVQPKAKKKKKQKEEDLLLDISGVSIRFDMGPLKGQIVDFDVDFQSANTVSIVISVEQKELAESLAPGTRLSDLQCYSPITVFRSHGIVAGKATVKQGPRKGDYMVDINIEGE
jgi:tetratricopeptide (TPR) repeat protein